MAEFNQNLTDTGR